MLMTIIIIVVVLILGFILHVYIDNKFIPTMERKIEIIEREYIKKKESEKNKKDTQY